MANDQNQPRNSSKDIIIGKIANIHGVKGLVKILPYCEDLSLIEEVSTHKITLKNQSGKYILASIEGVNSREDAEKLKGTELFVSRDALPEPEDGEFYYEDLKGLKVIDENGNDIGTVKSVDNFGAGDLLEIKHKSGDTFFHPFTDEYVPEVNLENKTLTIIKMVEPS